MYILFPIHAFASSTLSPFASSFVSHCPSRFRYPSLYPSCCPIALLSGCSSILKLNWKMDRRSRVMIRGHVTTFPCRGIIFIVQLQPPSHDESTTTTATSRLVKDDKKGRPEMTRRDDTKNDTKGQCEGQRDTKDDANGDNVDDAKAWIGNRMYIRFLSFTSRLTNPTTLPCYSLISNVCLIRIV